MLQRFIVITILYGLLLGLSACQPTVSPSENASAMQTNALWVGTYTRKEGHVDGKAAGIYHYQLNPTPRIASINRGIHNPSFIRLSPDGRYLYAVSETGPDVDTTGYVYAYAIAGDSLQFLNRQPTFSFAPCHLSVHPDGKQLFLTNYVGGTIVRYPLLADGRIHEFSDKMILKGNGPHERQDNSHPHSATPSPDGKWVMVADLGTDIIHSFPATGTRWGSGPEVQLPTGAGPRHLAFHPSAAFAYSINELNSTLTAFHYDASNGALNIIDHYTSLPESFEGDNLTADIHISPNGKWLYASNRGHNSIASFAIDQQQGTLRFISHTPCGGDFPRNFAITPDGQQLWVANQNTDNLYIFNLDDQTGRLQALQEIAVPTPVCLQFN